MSLKLTFPHQFHQNEIHSELQSKNQLPAKTILGSMQLQQSLERGASESCRTREIRDQISPMTAAKTNILRNAMRAY